MKWGPWTLNTDHMTLVHQGGYEVSLGDCTGSAAILDWIFQIQGKTWADDATLVGLLAAFDEVLHPQENYCSLGVDHKADGAALARTYAANPNARNEMFAAFVGKSQKS